MEFDQAVLDRLPPEKRELFEQLQAAHKELLATNPLEGFHACATPCGALTCQAREKQHEFMASMTRIVAAFAGNRFGKTTANVVWAIIQHTPVDMLPERLRPFKRPRKDYGPVNGRYLLPSIKSILTIVLPEFRRWCPPAILKDQSWAKAWSTQHSILSFDDGGRLEFYTYEQEPAVMVGATLDYVIYDEPPPEGHFHENLVRTTDRAGCHRFGMTPVNMKGGGIGWIKREILDAKEDPNITVIRATIHDNPQLSPEEIEFTLSQFPEDERQAREFGDFVHFGGMIYPGGFEQILVDPVYPPPDGDRLPPERLRGCDIYVGIDPGLKNAAFIWVAWDRDGTALAFAEVVLKEKTPLDYVRAIRIVNSRYRLQQAPVYVIDPSAKNRSLTNAQSIQSELQIQGISTIPGQNDVQAGVQNVRRRIKEGALLIGENLTGLRGEAEEYRMDDTDDGEFKVVKENDHRLDALRYVMMTRPYYGNVAARLREESWQPGIAPSADWFAAQDLEGPYDGPPLGALS